MKIKDLLEDQQPNITQADIMYHVTLSDNLPNIMKYGLQPKIGKRSSQLSENNAIFLFPTEDDAENALMNWLGDQFDEDDQLILLKVKIPDKTLLKDSSAAYEKMYYGIIPPNNIAVVKNV